MLAALLAEGELGSLVREFGAIGGIVIILVYQYVGSRPARKANEIVQHELKPNGGKSVKDHIERLVSLEGSVTRIEAKIDAGEKSHDRMEERMNRIEDRLDKALDG